MVEDYKKFGGRRSAEGSGLSDADERLLSAFFDGETSAKESAQVSQNLKSGENAWNGTLEQFQLIQEELRDWNEQETIRWMSAPGKTGVWNTIEHELRRIQRERFEKENGFSSRISQFFKPSSARMAFSFGLGIACTIFVLSVALDRQPETLSGAAIALKSSGGSAPALMELASTAQDHLSVNDELTRGEIHAGVRDLPQFGAATLPALTVPEKTTATYLQQLLAARELKGEAGAASGEQPGAGKVLVSIPQRAMPNAAPNGEGMKNWSMHLPARRVFGGNFLTGGLQAEGADIHWLYSSRPLDLLPTETRADPPVIWVSRPER